MESKQIKIGAILSYVQMALNVIIGLIYTPIMIHLLGQNEYGLYNTVASTISMLSILNMGFSSSYIKYFARYKAKDEYVSINKLNGLFLIIFFIIGGIALTCGLFFTFNLKFVFDQGLTAEEMETAKILMTLFSINLAIAFPMSVFSNIISANEKFIFLKLLGIIKTVVSPLITIPLLFLGFGSIAIVSVTLIISIFVDIVNVYYVLIVLKNKFIFHDFEKGIFKSLFTYTSFIAINIIIDQINWNIDKVLLGRYKGTVAVAVYSVGATLQTYYQMFSTAISGIFTPRIHNIINSNIDNKIKNREITSLFIKIGRIQYMILGLVCTELIFFGREFIKFWAGPEYAESYYVGLLLIIPVTVPLMQNLGIEIQRAQNKHQFRSLVYAIMAGINLCLSIILCQLYGAIGAAIGTTLSLIIANGLIMNIYYHKKCGIDIIKFWKNIWNISLGFIFPILVGIFLKNIFGYKKLLSLCFGILLYAIVYVISIYKVSLNNEEKQFINTMIHKLIKRRGINA